MAIIEAQGWQWAANAAAGAVFDRQENWTRVDAVTFSKAGGPFADATWYPANIGDFLDVNNLGGLSTIYFACYLKCEAIASSSVIVSFGEGTAGSGTAHITFTRDVNGAISCRRGTGTGTVLFSFDASDIHHKWVHFAVKLVIDETAGAVVVEINGDERANETTLDTRNGGTSGIIDYFRFEGYFSITRLAAPIFWSDTGDSPTAFFGLHRVFTIRPDGDSSVQFTRLSGTTNWEMVDEDEYDDDTSYNESSTSTNKDRLTCGSLPTTANTVYSVQAKAMATDPDATPTESIQVGVNSGTESLGSSKSLSGSYELWEGGLETVDPNTAAAWTVANVNNTDLVYVHA